MIIFYSHFTLEHAINTYTYGFAVPCDGDNQVVKTEDEE